MHVSQGYSDPDLIQNMTEFDACLLVNRTAHVLQPELDCKKINELCSRFYVKLLQLKPRDMEQRLVKILFLFRHMTADAYYAQKGDTNWMNPFYASRTFCQKFSDLSQLSTLQDIDFFNFTVLQSVSHSRKEIIAEIDPFYTRAIQLLPHAQPVVDEAKQLLLANIQKIMSGVQPPDHLTRKFDPPVISSKTETPGLFTKLYHFIFRI